MFYRLVFSIIVLLFTIHFPLSAQSTLDDYYKVKEKEYILYAPNKSELKKAQTKLSFASQEFSKFFDSDPPQISVFILNNPSLLTSLDLSKIKNESQGFLPFISEQFMDDQTRNTSGVFTMNMGALIMEQNNRLMVATVLEQNNHPEINIRKADIIKSINGAEVSDIETFKKIYGQSSPDDVIELQLIRNNNTIKASFKKPDGSSKPQVQISSKNKNSHHTKTSTVRPLTHEACHIYFKAYVNNFSKQPEKIYDSNYGSPYMPDWLDEAAATLCEVDKLQNSRTVFLLENLEQRYRLEDLFTMDHPLANMSMLDSEGDKAQIKVHKLEEDNDITTKLKLFYSQAQSIATYLVDKTNPSIMNDLTEYYSGNIEGLQDFLKTREELPDNIAALEDDWLKWLKE